MATRNDFKNIVKSPLTPLFQRGESIVIPLFNKEGQGEIF
jgi:hypothetical protein